MIITPESSDSLEIGDLTCYLYLPFLHRLGREGLAKQRKDNLGCDTTNWSHWLGHENGKYREHACEAKHYFLPHIQSIFYPEPWWNDENETAANKGVEPKSHAQNFAIRRWWKNPSVPEYGGLKLYEDNLVLIIKKTQSATPKQGNVGSKEEQHEEVSFKIGWIDVILFPQHIGILLIKVILNDIDLSQAANFIRAMRKHQSIKLLTYDVPDVRNNSNVRLPWSTIVNQAIVPWCSPDGSYIEVFGASLKTLSVVTINIPAEERMRRVVRKRLEQAAFALSSGHNPFSRELYDLVSSVEFRRRRKHNMVYSWKNALILGDPEGVAITTATIKGTDKVSENYKHYARLAFDRAEWGDSWSYALTLAQYIRLHSLIRKTAELRTVGKEGQKETAAFEKEYIRFRKTLWHHQVSARPAIQLAYRHFCSIYRLESMADALHKNLEIVRSYLHEERARQEDTVERANSRLLVALTISGGLAGFVLVGNQIHILSTLTKWFHFRLPFTSQETWAVLVLLAVFVWLLSITYKWFKSCGKRNKMNDEL